MRRLRVLLQRIRGLWRQERLDSDLHHEIADHLEEAAEEYIRQGLSPAEARRAARISFGNVTQTEEAHREGRSFVWLERVGRDARYALRTLWTQPALTVAVVGSLALGIGANAAIFSLLNGLILKSLPVAQPDRLVQVTPGGNFGAWTYPLWQELHDRQDVLDGVFAWSTQSAAFDLSTGGSVDVASGLWVSGSFFDVLGVESAIGRTLRPADDARGGGPDGLVAVISHRFWQRRFTGAGDVVGRTISIERVPFRIVGVTAAGFVGPNVGSAFDVAIPIGTQPLVLRRDRLDQRKWWWLNVMGRLKPNQTANVAAEGLARLQPTLRDLTRPPDMRPGEASSYLNTPITVVPAPGGPSSFRDTYRHALTALMGIVGLVLLIACVNVANLLLARAERRRASISLQLALGASRFGLVRQSLIESLLLSSLGALVGFAMAQWGGQWLVAQLPAAGNEPFLDLSLDWRVIGFTTGLATAVAILFGTAPALHATRVDPMDALRGRRGASVSSQGFGSHLLVAVQFGLCLVLVAASGLFVRTFTSLAGRDSGIDRDRVLVVRIDGRHSQLTSTARALALSRRLTEAIRSLPGVSEVSFSAVTPVSNNEWDTTIENPRGLALEEKDRRVYKNEISPRWFQTYGVPMVSGRDFSDEDQKQPQAVAIVNEAFARRYFDGRNPIGETIREVGSPADPQPELTIVGLVRDAVYVSLREVPPATMYLPAAGSGTISIRAESRTPARLGPAVMAAIAGVDRDLGVSIRPLADDFAGFVARERMLMLLSGFFGVLALLLAGLGLYGVVSYGVGARRTEIGIRMALGSSRASVVGLIVRRVAILMSLGVLIGLPASIWTGYLLSSLLFDVSPADPLTHAAAVLILVAVGVVAAWAPARRAAGVNPAITLKA